MTLPDLWPRRRLLRHALVGGGLLSLGGCALNPLGPGLASLTRPLNEALEIALQSRGAVPEFLPAQVEPAALLVNSFNGVPAIEAATFSLRVEGLVRRPLRLSLKALAALPQHEMVIRHVCVEGWDRRTALHPQTLLVTRMNGAPLPAANGAPLRLASPLKLGYKQSKWVTGLRLLATLDPLRRGTWEDQGYEWFAGL